MAALAGAACGDKRTTADLIKQYRPRLDAIRATFTALHSSLATAELPATPTAADPPIVFTPGKMDAQYRPLSSGNAVVLAYENLTRLDLDVMGWQGGDLMMVFRWASEPPQTMSASTEASMKPAFESAVAVRYAVVIRTLAYVEPKVTKQPGELGGGTFTPGSLRARTYLVDLTTRAILAGFDVDVVSRDEVNYLYKPDDPGSYAAADTAVHSALDADLKAQVKAKLNAYGTFEFGY